MYSTVIEQPKLTNEKIGLYGEAKASAYFFKRGFQVLFPRSQNNYGYDFVVEKEGKLSRIQVKASAFYRMGKPEICIMGGGKTLDTSAFDFLFVIHMCGLARLYPAADAPKKSTSFNLKNPTPTKFDIVL
jgi:hypothetical protein